MRPLHIIWIVIIAIGIVFAVKKYHIQPQSEVKKSSESSNKIQLEGYSKSDGTPITLTRNPDSQNVSWKDVMDFLAQDQTEKKLYIPNVYTCAHFAEDMYNRAQRCGMRCGVVTIEFEGQAEGHCINAFETTDKGLILIDATGIMDKTVKDNSKLPAIKSVGYLKEGKVYFSIPLTASLAREFPADYSAGEYYMKEQERLNGSQKDLTNTVSNFNNRVKDYQQRQNALAQRIAEWKASEQQAIARHASGKDMAQIRDQLNELRTEQSALQAEAANLESDQDKIQDSQSVLNKQSDYLKWYNKTTEAPVKKYAIYW